MKNHKQLLADFYLALLTISNDDKEKFANLHDAVLDALAHELYEDRDIVQRIFGRMAEEDAKI